MQTRGLSERAQFLFPLLLVGLGALYVSLSARVDIGYYNDDASYVLAARSLSEGRYADWTLPGRPSNIDRLPGYPAFLLPFVMAIQPHWDWLKLTSIGLMLLSYGLIWMLFRGFLSPVSRLALIACVGLNPTVMKYAVSVMSEPGFLFLSLGAFLFLRQWLETAKVRYVAGLVLSLAWTLMMRPEGLALLSACVAGLAIGRRWRSVLLCGFLAPIPLALWIIRNLYWTHSPSGYVHQGEQSLAYFSGHIPLLLKNVLITARVFWLDTTLQAAIPAHQPAWAMAPMLGLAGMTLWIGFRGVSVFARAAQMPHELRIAVGLYIGASLALHAFFPAVNTRYFLVLLPFTLAALIAGLISPLSSKVSVAARCALAGSALAFLYLNPWSSPADKFLGVEHDYHVPQQTYAWIKQGSISSAFFLTTKSSTLSLMTGRCAVSSVPGQDLESLRYQLLRRGITHILITPNRLLALPSREFRDMFQFWQSAEPWMQDWPQSFEKQYENGSEKTQIYRVIPDPRFTKAYEWYAKADADFSRKNWAQGLENLRRALTLYPNFPGALNFYGQALLYSGGDLNLAQEKLNQALALRPYFSSAWINLAELFRRQGNPDQARRCLVKAQDSLSKQTGWSGDAVEIEQRIHQESAELKRPPE